MPWAAQVAREARFWKQSPREAAALVDGAEFPLAHWPEVRQGVNECDLIERIDRDVDAQQRRAKKIKKGEQQRSLPYSRALLEWHRDALREADDLPPLRRRTHEQQTEKAPLAGSVEAVDHAPISDEEMDAIAARHADAYA